MLKFTSMDFSGEFYLALILLLLSAEYLLNIATALLNLKNISPALPEEFKEFYDADKYARSQEYLRENTGFDACAATFTLIFSCIFILEGGFNVIDSLARAFGLNPVLTGLIFSFSLKFLLDIIELPFEIYDTFVLEGKYGFNRTTPGVFALDLLKEWGLSVLIGAPALAAVLWIFGRWGTGAWIYGWTFVTIVQLFIAFISPALLLPLFNKFKPLEDGELRREIEAYAAKEKFKMSGIFVMDGSKRSSKANAFFTGFGTWRRIVLFDTLIEKHSVSELTAVLAHEMGHHRKHHVLMFTVLGILQTGFMLWLLSRFIGNPGLFAAFKMENISIYASLVFFGFIYSPISFFLGIFINWLSRNHELEADKYSVNSYGHPQELTDALKKLAVDNLSNLRPHPMKVLLEYSHPPILERLKKIRATVC